YTSVRYSGYCKFNSRRPNFYFMDCTCSFSNLRCSVFGRFKADAIENIQQKVFTRAPIDSTEAGITVNDRKLQIEKYKLELNKKALELSNFLWLENNIPLELQENIIPDAATPSQIDMVLQLSKITIENQNLNNHPKLQSLNFKLKQQEVDTQLKRNKLLPTLNLEYNFLTQNPDLSNTFNTVNYKSCLYFTMPLSLRKERGELKLAKVKLDYTKFEISNTQVTLLNTLKALQTELESFEKQNTYLQKIVTDYQLLVTAEERKLEMGDSSIFLINTRENALIDAKLKAVELQYHFLVVKAKLFNNLAVNPNS